MEARYAPNEVLGPRLQAIVSVEVLLNGANSWQPPVQQELPSCARKSIWESPRAPLYLRKFHRLFPRLSLAHAYVVFREIVPLSQVAESRRRLRRGQGVEAIQRKPLALHPRGESRRGGLQPDLTWRDRFVTLSGEAGLMVYCVESNSILVSPPEYAIPGGARSRIGEATKLFLPYHLND
jgi:hypothetical protein